MNPSTGTAGLIPASWLLAFVSILSFWKIFLIQDVIWDDNTWLQSIYSTDSVQSFNDTGWTQLHRPTIGAFLYIFLGLHRYTDSFFLIWHTLALLTQFASALLLYLFVKDLSKDKLLAIFTALSFLVFHLDQSLPFASSITYRIGLTLSIASLYLTVRACSGEKIRWALLALSGLYALIAHSVFIEHAVSLEPGRLAVIGYCLYRRPERGASLVRKTLTCWSFFLALAVPLIIFKLTNKPYGIYQATYATDPWFFLKWKQYTQEIMDLLFFDWLTFWKLSKYADVWSFILLPLATIFFFNFLWRLRIMPASVAAEAGGINAHTASSWRFAILSRPVTIFALGFLFLIPPLLMIKYAGLDFYLKGTQNNTHGIYAQVGYAIIIGNVVTMAFTRIAQAYPTRRTLYILLGGLFGLGAYYNNIGLDLYQDSWQRQTLFWQTFIKRFPTLPEKADFYFDVDDEAKLSDLRIHYDFEANLNLLYARSTDPSKFRSYRVFVPEEYRNLARKRGVSQLDDSTIERLTPWGRDTLEPRQFIVVSYRPGELLVNREIKQRAINYQQLHYGNWLDRDLPTPLPAGNYPLRHRLQGF